MTRQFKSPRTRLEDLLDYKKSVRAELNLSFARKEAGMDPDSVDSYMHERIDSIYQQYQPKLYKSDFYFFRTLGELGTFLRDVGCFDSDLIERTIVHENSHRTKAHELGYGVKGFSCFLVLDAENKIKYIAGTSIRCGSSITREEFRAIALAPDDPSIMDRY